MLSNKPIVHSACTSVGIRCFINVDIGPVFRGDLKTKPEDFIVTEIDESGQLASMEEGKVALPVLETAPTSANGERTTDTAAVTTNAVSSKAPTVSQAPTASPAPTPKFLWDQLNETVSSKSSMTKILGGEQNLAKLEAFADLARSQILDQCVEADSASNESCTLFRVPCDPLDRSGRKIIHQAVMMTYPFLKTDIVPGKGATDMDVPLSDILLSKNKLLDPLKSILSSTKNVSKTRSQF